MQYILTEDEYKNLTPLARAKKLESENMILSIMIAEKENGGCVAEKTAEYCDHCC